jgi:hypothetical protein
MKTDIARFELEYGIIEFLFSAYRTTDAASACDRERLLTEFLKHAFSECEVALTRASVDVDCE